jgi:uncharacterized protein
MRLPTINNDPARIDEPEATRMIRTAIDHGVNYVDTAYGYHGGASEPFVGRALQDGYRRLVRLATKAPVWLFKEREDFDKYLAEQLARLQTERIDYYLLHGLGETRWKNMLELDVLRSAERALADGRIAHFGFSFHDKLDAFKAIVDGYGGWSFCQIQYNFMDEHNQAGVEGLRYAAEKGLAVVVMEPIRGGNLTRNTPEVIRAIWDSAPIRRTPADWALQWVLNQPEASLALSGMSTMQHVIENLESADRSAVGALSVEDLALIGRVRDAYKGLTPVPCTACNYCMPCKQGVNIPGLFQGYNQAAMYNDWRWGKMAYRFAKPEERANHCIQCRECEEKCPQAIEISDWMPKVHEALKEEQPAT